MERYETWIWRQRERGLKSKHYYICQTAILPVLKYIYMVVDRKIKIGFRNAENSLLSSHERHIYSSELYFSRTPSSNMCHTRASNTNMHKQMSKIMKTSFMILVSRLGTELCTYTSMTMKRLQLCMKLLWLEWKKGEVTIINLREVPPIFRCYYCLSYSIWILSQLRDICMNVWCQCIFLYSTVIGKV